MGKSSRGSRCCHRWHSGGEKEKERGRDGRCLSSPLSLRLWTGFVFGSLMQVRTDNNRTCMRGRHGPEHSRSTKVWPADHAQIKSEIKRWEHSLRNEAVMMQGRELTWTTDEHGSCSSTVRIDSAPLFTKPDLNYREWLNERPNTT